MNMTNKAQRRERPADRSAPTWALSATAGAAALLIAATAQAQQAPAEENAQTIVVTGIRHGIESAISTKKNSDAIVEAVSAEDIGKLPDVSIAESLARLPGLAAQRVAGRAQVIAVRGLSPDLTTTTLNGRELVSTGDNRSVEFDQYPSELMSGVTVYKTGFANLVGQGLAGTIDMQSVRPLNYGQRAIALNARVEQNSLGAIANAKDTGNRFSISYIDQFADRTFGLVLGYAHLQTPVLEHQVGLYEPWGTVGADSNGNPDRPGLPVGTYKTDGIKSLARSGETQRDGFMGTLEWRPNKAFTSTLDLYYSKFKSEDTANQFEVNLGNYNGGGDTDPKLLWTDTAINGNNTQTAGTANNVYPLVRGMYNKREDTIKAVGWNNKFKAGEATYVVDAAYSNAKRDELSLENNTQLVPFPQVLDSVRVNYGTGGFPTLTPGLNYSDPNSLLVRGTIYGSGYGKVPHIDDTLKSVKGTATFPLPESVNGVLPELEVGLNYSDRAKHKRQPEAGINLGPQGDTTIPADLQYSPVNLGFSGTGIIPAWNVPGVVDRYMTFTPSETAASYLIAKAWNVYEKITTGFLQASIDSKLGSLPVRGNVGLQMQHVDQSSTSNYWDSSAPAGQEVKPVSDGKTYTDVLPSLNLNFDLGNDQLLRFAIAQQVARPRVDQLRSAVDFGVDSSTGKPGASGGNPRLDPWRANALDLSYEKYFGTKAYFAATGFYKDLKSYIYTQSRDNYDFSKFVADYTPPTSCNGGPCPPVQTTGTFKAPFNGQGGKLEGLELTASVPFKMLTPALDGFGVIASATITNSNIQIKDPDSATSVGDGPITLPGLSKNQYDLTLYYEKSGFEARVSGRYRSDFIGEISNFSASRVLRYVEGETIVDAQIGYGFESGPMKGVGLLLQVNNLNNAPYKTYAGTKDRPLEYIEWGRSVLLGASYKF